MTLPQPDRTQAPPFRPIESYTLPKPERRQLSNGQPLFVWKTHTQPVVSLQMLLRAGRVFEEQPNTAAFVAKMLAEGTRARDHSEITDYIAQRGAYLNIRVTGHFLEIDLFCLPRFLPEMLKLLHEILTTATFPAERLRQVANLEVEQLRVNRQKNGFTASELFREQLFGKAHPSGRHLTPERMRAISSEELQTFFESHVRLRPAEWLLTGVFSEDIPQLIDRYFGQDELRPLPEFPVYPPTPDYRVFDRQKEQSVQTSLRFGRLTLNPTSAGFPALRVLNEVFGGYFGSRLMQNLREKKGLTYGIFSQLQPLRNQPAIWFIGADVRKENRQEARDEIFRELNKLQEELLEEDELETVLNALCGSFVGDLSTPFAVTEKFRQLRRLGLPDTHYDTLIPAWRQVSPEAIRAAAQQYGQGDWLEVFVG